MYCPRPGKTEKQTNTATPGEKTVSAPPVRTESCNATSSTVVTDPSTGSSSTITTTPVYVPTPGPAGPQGPAGDAGLNGLGFKYRGEWTTDYLYKKEDGQTNPLADVVVYDGQAWVCIQDNISTEGIPTIIMSPGAPIADWSTVTAGSSNAGNGIIATIEVTDTRMYIPGTFTVEFINAVDFDVKFNGTMFGSGSIADTPEFNSGGLKLTFVEGDTEWQAGDTFTFDTIYGIDPNPANIGNGKVVDIFLNTSSIQGDYVITFLDAAQFTFEGETGEVGTPFYHAGIDVTFTVQAGSVDFDTDDYFDMRIQEVAVPQLNEPYFKPEVGSEYWDLFAAKGSLPEEDKGFFDSLKDNVFDWIKNASVTDLILAGTAVAGVIWAGAKIVDALTDDGEGDGNADSRYNGTPGLTLDGFTSPSVKEVISSLCEYANIPHDVSALDDTSCEFTIGESTSIRSILTTLSQAYMFDMVDSIGILRFVPRQVTPVKTLTESDIGFNTGNYAQTRYTGKRLQGISLPKSIALTYYDASLDYNTFTQVAQFHTFSEGQDVTLAVPVTMSAQQAKKVSELTLINSHLESTTYNFSTSYKHIDLEPGDVVSSPMGLIRITKIQESSDSEGILQFDATDAGGELAIEGSNLSPVIPPPSTNIPLTIGYSQAFFIDPPNLNSTDVDVRLYAAVHGYGAAGWPGAMIYCSTNNGASYTLIGESNTEATIGLVSTATASADYHVVDNVSTISVTLKTGSLLSVGDSDFWAGKNAAMIGQELIYFKNATLTGPKTYTLTGLLRGRQGTEQYVGTHVANELFCLMNSAVIKIALQDSDRGTVKKYKIVTKGSDISKVAAEDVNCVSNNVMMWTVTNAKIVKTGTDYTLSWDERVRYDNAINDLSTTNHDPDWGGYGVVVYTDNTYSTIKKSYTITSPLWIYSAAMQTTDFGFPQEHVYIRVAQMSKKWGPGYPVSLNM